MGSKSNNQKYKYYLKYANLKVRHEFSTYGLIHVFVYYHYSTSFISMIVACLFLWKELRFLIVILKYLVSLSLVFSALFDNREAGLDFCFLISSNWCGIKY